MRYAEIESTILLPANFIFRHRFVGPFHHLLEQFLYRRIINCRTWNHEPARMHGIGRTLAIRLGRQTAPL